MLVWAGSRTLTQSMSLYQGQQLSCITISIPITSVPAGPHSTQNWGITLTGAYNVLNSFCCLKITLSGALLKYVGKIGV